MKTQPEDTKLPPEIIRYILEFLPLKFLLTTVSLVSKQWSNHIYNHPPLWYTLKLMLLSGSACESFNKFCKAHTTLFHFVKRLDYTSHQNTDILNYSHHFTSLIELNWDKWKYQNVNKLVVFTNLTKLNLMRCRDLQNVDGIECLTKLIELHLNNNFCLTSVDQLANLTTLTVLNLQYCRMIENAQQLSKLTNLSSLNLANCQGIQSVDSFSTLMNLTDLNLEECFLLQNVDGLSKLTNITKLNLAHCLGLRNLDKLENLTNLTDLNIKYCAKLETFKGYTKLTNLTALDLRRCYNLRNVHEFKKLPKLKNLKMY